MWPRTSTQKHLFSNTLGHRGPHNMEPRTNQNKRWGEKKKAKGQEEIIASLLMFPIVSASFRMSSVNNLYEASPIDCE